MSIRTTNNLFNSPCNYCPPPLLEDTCPPPLVDTCPCSCPTGPCESAILLIRAHPAIVGTVGQHITFEYSTTNVSGNAISGPIIIVSSLFGNFLIRNGTFTAGEKISVSRSMMVTQSQLSSGRIVSNDYVATGRLSGTQYIPISTLSPTATITVTTQTTSIDVTGSVIISNAGASAIVNVGLGLDNLGPQPITSFSIDISKAFSGSSCSVSFPNNPNGLFTLSSGNILSLNSGQMLASGSRIRNILVRGVSCNGNPPMCNSNGCSFTYTYSTNGGPTMTGSRVLSIVRI